MVLLERAGDVIPKLVKVFQADDRVPVLEPEKCPSCGSPTTREHRGVIGVVTYCTNPAICPAACKSRIHTFMSKVDIKGVGKGGGIMDALCENRDPGVEEAGEVKPLVSNPADLYSLTVDQLKDLTIGVNSKGKPIRFGSSRASALVNEVYKAKTLTLQKFLGALGVDLLGRRRVEIIAKDQGLTTLEDWLNEEKLATIPGEILRKAITDGLKETRPVIDKLLAAGVVCLPFGQKPTKAVSFEVERPVDAVVEDLPGAQDLGVEPIDASTALSNSPVFGKSFCFTGTRELVDEVEAQGGIVKSGVSKGLQYLVQKDATSSSNKTMKAESYGTKIISVDCLRDVLAGNRQLPECTNPDE